MTNEELAIKITAEISDLKKELEKGKKEVENFSKKGDSAFKKFGDAAKKVGSAVKTGLKAASVAIAAGAAALVGLSASTEEYRVAQAKLVSAFEAAGSSADQAKSTYNELQRVLGDSDVAVEAANHLAKLTTNEKELSEWTNICQGVYATFGDSLPIEGLTEAANETAKVGTLTGSLADALNWAGVSEEKFQEQLDACNSEAEREALIRETLTGIYDEASKKYEENAASILAANEAQAKLTESLAKLGEAATPIVTIFKNFGASLLESLAPGLEQVSAGLQGLANGTEGASEQLQSGITSMITGIITKITEILPTLLTVGVQIITSLIQGIVSAMPQIIEALVQGITLIIETLPTLIETLAAALPTILPQLINGLVSLIILVCENFSSIIQPIIDNLPMIIMSIVTALLDNLPTLIQGVVDLAVGIVGATAQIIDVLLPMIPDIAVAIVGAIIESIPTILGGVWSIITAVLEAIWSLVGSIWEYMKKAWGYICGVFEPLGNWINEKVIQPVKNFFKGLWDGIKNIFKNVGSWFSEKFQGAVDKIKSVFGKIKDFFTGIWNSIKSIFSKVGETIGGAITNTVKKAINSVLKTATKIINGFISAINIAISVINAIPGVNIKKLSKLEVPALAKGGVVEDATLAMIGEDGKEAVVPLENNTEWIDKLADKLAAKTGGSTPIILNVDGKTFAQTAINTMNELTRQTGSLALKLY